MALFLGVFVDTVLDALLHRVMVPAGPALPFVVAPGRLGKAAVGG